MCSKKCKCICVNKNESHQSLVGFFTLTLFYIHTYIANTFGYMNMTQKETNYFHILLVNFQFSVSVFVVVLVFKFSSSRHCFIRTIFCTKKSEHFSNSFQYNSSHFFPFGLSVVCFFLFLVNIEPIILTLFSVHRSAFTNYEQFLVQNGKYDICTKKRIEKRRTFQNTTAIFSSLHPFVQPLL